MMGEAAYHIPVLLNESVSGLAIRPDGVYVDLTYGGGGHSREIIRHLKTGKLIAFDQDPAVISHLIQDKKFHFVQHNYRFLANHLHYMNIAQVDGILADLGISSEHIDNPERGFSFRYEAKLDMRMNPDIPGSAADIVNHAPESELTRIFREYGEVSQASRVARIISETRKTQPITTTVGLADCLRPLVPGNKENKLGAAKLTMASFHRIAGGSTQLRGVVPDIVIPSVLDHLEIGEEYLPNALAYSIVPPAHYRSVADIASLIPALRTKSEARRAGDAHFQAYERLLARVAERQQSKEVTLNLSKRLDQAHTDRDLDNLQKDTLEDDETAANPKAADKQPDLALREAERVLVDLIPFWSQVAP